MADPNVQAGALSSVEGGPTVEDNAVQGAAETISSGNVAIGGGKGSALNIGKTPLSPEQTTELYDRMKEMVEQKTGGWHDFMSGLKDAAAWAVPGIRGQKALALQARDQEKRAEMQDVFNMRAQMAGLKSKQDMIAAMNKADAAMGLGGPGVTGSGVNTTGLNPLVIARYNAMKYKDPDAADKFINDAIKDLNKATVGQQFAPNMNDLVEVPFRRIDPITGKEVLGMEQVLRSEAVRRQGADAANRLPATIPSGSQDARAAIKRGIFGQESTSGTRDTSQPNTQGVQGPMQIKDTTFKMYQDMGVIPKNFKIDNPYQNKIAGDLIVDYLYDQHKGDTRKVAAEYYGGSGAINKDGTINLTQSNPMRPKDPNVGQYIDQVHQKAGLGLQNVAAQAPQVTAPSAAAPAPSYNVASNAPVVAPTTVKGSGVSQQIAPPAAPQGGLPTAAPAPTAALVPQGGLPTAGPAPLPATSALSGVRPAAQMPISAGPVDIAAARAAGKIAEETQMAGLEGMREQSRGAGKATNELLRFADEESRLRPLIQIVKGHAKDYPDEFAVASKPDTGMGAASWIARAKFGPEGREFVEENAPDVLIRPGAKERRDKTAAAATQIGIKAISDMFSGNSSVRVGAQISNLVQSGKGLGLNISAPANKTFADIAELGLDRAVAVKDALKQYREATGNKAIQIDDLPKEMLWKIDDWVEKQAEQRGIIPKLSPQDAAKNELKKREIRNITVTGTGQ